MLKPFFDLLVLNDDIFAGTDNGLVKFSLVSNDLLVQIAGRNILIKSHV